MNKNRNQHPSQDKDDTSKELNNEDLEGVVGGGGIPGTYPDFPPVIIQSPELPPALPEE